MINPLTPSLVRAARALLGWTQSDLAKRANLSASAVRDFETATRLLLKNNLMGIQTALEGEGIVFDYPPGSDDVASIRRVARGTNLVIVADPRWPTGTRRV